MPELWIVRTRPQEIGNLARADALKILSEEERRRARGQANDARRGAFIAARVALRAILAPFAEGLERGAPLARTSHGKPYIAGGPEFSFSATEGAAIVAISPEGAVGADIERVRDIAHAGAALRRLPALAAFADQPEIGGGDVTLRFLTAWTRFEASLKFDGLPIGPALGDLAADGPPGIAAGNRPHDTRVPRTVSDVDAGHGFVAACAHVPGTTLTIRTFDWRARLAG